MRLIETAVPNHRRRAVWIDMRTEDYVWWRVAQQLNWVQSARIRLKHDL